ncbi:MAG: dTMP kinase [Patescibacteria group bacterium]
MSERGKYVVIEGHDGTGKSTQVDMLRARLSGNYIKAISVEEPAGAPIADELRKIIKNGELERDPTTNLLLFTAARRATDIQIIQPALERGEWVVAARNWVSTLAYQGYGEGENLDDIWSMTEQFTGPRYISPDFICVLSLQNEIERTERIGQRGELENPDTFESRGDDFQQDVERGYLEVADQWGIPVIDASGTKAQINDKIWRHIEPLTEAA